MNKRYCLHPGYICSETDGDLHYVGIAPLIRLYNLDPKKHKIIVLWGDDRDSGFAPMDDDVHLYPKYDGREYETSKQKYGLV